MILRQLQVHFAGFIWVFSFFKIAPIEIEVGIKVEEKLFVVSENVEHLGVLVGFVFKIVKDFLPQLNVMHLRHQHSLVAIGGVLDRGLSAI